MFSFTSLFFRPSVHLFFLISRFLPSLILYTCLFIFFYFLLPVSYRIFSSPLLFSYSFFHLLPFPLSLSTFYLCLIHVLPSLSHFLSFISSLTSSFQLLHLYLSHLSTFSLSSPDPFFPPRLALCPVTALPLFPSSGSPHMPAPSPL